MKEKVNQPATGEKNSGWQKTKLAFQKTGRVLGIIGKVLFYMRKLFLAAPVVWFAVRLYGYAMEELPETVGILLQETGDYYHYLPKDTAAMGCVAVTAACLLMMFLSRRTLYPWLISVFSLVLPFLLILTNIFPG